MEYNKEQVLEVIRNNENFQEVKNYNWLLGVSKETNRKTRAKGKKEVINFYFFWNDAISLDGWYKAREEMNDWAKKNKVELSQVSNDFDRPHEVRHLYGRIKTFWRDWRNSNINEIFYKLSDIFNN